MPSKLARIVILFIFAGLLVLSGMGITNLRFEFSFEAFLPKDNAELKYYHETRSKFARSDASIMLAVGNKGGVFDREFLGRVAQFTKDCRKLPFVNDVNALTNLKDYIYDPNFPIVQKVLDWKNSEDLVADSVRIMNDPRFRNNFISDDGALMAVHLSLERVMNDSAENVFNPVFDSLMTATGFDEWYAIGHPIVHYQLKNMQEKQFGLYIGIATIVMFLCMVMIFRRIIGILVSFGAVFAGMVIFFGFLGWIGRPLDLMSTLYPILMVIVGTSDVVHILTKYADELNRGKSKKEAIRITLKEIGMATFLTSLTTAIGFVSLISSDMPPIKYFGLFAAAGVFIAFITVIVLTTTLISWFNSEQLMSPGKWKFRRFLNWINDTTYRYPKKIAIITLFICALSLFGSMKMNTGLTAQRDLPRRSKLLSDFRVIDREFKGVNSMDFAIETGEGYTFDDYAVLRELEKIETYLTENDSIGPIHSPLIYFKLANLFSNYGNVDQYRLALKEEDFENQKKIIESRLRDSTKGMISNDKKTGFMYVKYPDFGSVNTDRIFNNADRWVSSNIDPEILKIHKTGHRYLFDKNQGRLVRSLLYSLGLAFLTVSFFMALVFKNWKILIVSLIPNIVPLLITGGVIGLLQLELDPKIAIIFTIAFGIAVDDSIHFLARYQLEKKKGKGINDSITATYNETGKAIIITSIILFFGFGSLAGSVFPPTYTIGSLLSATLAVALFADLFLIPVCLRWITKE